MSIKKYALINQETGIVENVILLKADSVWPIPQGHFLIDVDNLNPIGTGMKYENGGFIFINGEDIPQEE